ncbi:MAG: putative addiction module antidote protein [Azoarcus sp.]|jgi:probable addiction module antidote protein|nr:putative addiction module antidote protein [Azoarcus sp.]
MALETTPFDMAEMLDSEEVIREYFAQVVADGDTDEIVDALGHIARARGMAKLAEETGLGRVSLYKALAHGAKPRFDTILKVTRALGLRLTVAHP